MRIRQRSSLRSLWFAGIVLLFFTPSGQAQSTSCPVPSPGIRCGVSVGISPFVTGGAFGGFQSNPGTGVSAPITVTFSLPVASVSVTALDPDFPGNRMDAFNAGGGLVSSVPFAGDGTPGVFTTSTATVTGAGIARVVLVPASADFVAYDGLSFTRPYPPVASFYWINQGMTVSFNASNSYDPDGNIVDYLWDFGDGSGFGYGVTPSHTYSAEGCHTVTLTVQDNQGFTDYRWYEVPSYPDLFFCYCTCF